ncbi:MAG TPA: hypothetical protein VHE30_23910 [Polyangiaceae bacterium]|nr:hypothetical protein [Polyangiaceae bacterium]
MTPLALAWVSIAFPSAFFALVFVAGFVGRRFAEDEFSWPKYAAFVVVALGLAVLLVAAKTTWVFLVVAGVLVLWVLIRGALDAQVTSIRERFGFLQLYAALLVVEYSALVRTGALAGTRATAAFSLALDDALSELVLPLSLAARGARPSMGAEALVGSAVDALSANLLSVVALATFALSAFVYTHFAEHATPKVGLSLFPSPVVAAVLWPALLVLSRVLPGDGLPGIVATTAAVFLRPYFVAEGLWVVHRFAARLRIRGALVLGLAALAAVSAGLCQGIALLGLGFHVVRLRAFEPILGDVERSAARPRIRTALAVAAVSSAVFAALGLLDARALARTSPRLAAGGELCDGVKFTTTPAGVLVASEAGSFTIDSDETSLDGSADAACRARGARLCTSDEWMLACVCSYPNESVGGIKLGENDRLVFRVETDARDGTPADVQRLLSGRTEVVSTSLGHAMLLAGPADAFADDSFVDCRTRLVVTEASRLGAASVGAVRCCR